ncbi:unnamed protein product [Angiostrongylus costaricensis]|uniref:Uncharacterized protein n=1 Tax=Angiostrongylus costaricensis TaxID=334426 RepID=A0A0R3PHC8_ANGCS|nr:unnamed protein product [Angiostrongylus costaricensis]
MSAQFKKTFRKQKSYLIKIAFSMTLNRGEKTFRILFLKTLCITAFADQSSSALHRDYVPSSHESELLPHVAARNSPSSAWRCDGRNVQSISGESSLMTRHSNGPANEQGQCYFLEGDLDIINERPARPANQSVLCDSSINLLQRAFSRNGRNVMSERFWIDMRDLQLQWIEKICTSSFERTAATSYTLECWTILTKFFSMFRVR